MDLRAFAADFTVELWMILTESALWLLAGLLFAGVVHAMIPSHWITAQLTGRGLKPILRASLLGVPLPLCSCAVIPVAASLREAGASKGAAASFAISTPQTGEESIPLTWALFGPVFALTRPVVAVFTALAAGLLIERFATANNKSDRNTKRVSLTQAKPCCHSDPKPKPQPEPTRPCCHSSSKQPKPGLTQRIKSAFHHAFGTMLNDLAPWLAAGFILSALIAAAIPANWIDSNINSQLAQMGLVLLVSLPVYVCATSSTPLAFTLAASAGLSPGAALVLLLAGPATNTATMAWALKDLGARALAIYIITIATIAVASGLAFNAALASFVTLADPTSQTSEPMTASVITGAGAGLLTALMLYACATRVIRSIRNSQQGQPDTAEPSLTSR